MCWGLSCFSTRVPCVPLFLCWNVCVRAWCSLMHPVGIEAAEWAVWIMIICAVLLGEGWLGVYYRHILTEDQASQYCAGLFHLLLGKIMRNPQRTEPVALSRHTVCCLRVYVLCTALMLLACLSSFHTLACTYVASVSLFFSHPRVHVCC